MPNEIQEVSVAAPVVCSECKQPPKFEKGIARDNSVWWALECKCGKTTPLYRSSSVTQSVWEGLTHSQSKEDARAKFLSDSPSFFTNDRSRS